MPVESSCGAREEMFQKATMLCPSLFPAPARFGAHYPRFIPRNEMILRVWMRCVCELSPDVEVCGARVALGGAHAPVGGECCGCARDQAV